MWQMLAHPSDHSEGQWIPVGSGYTPYPFRVPLSGPGDTCHSQSCTHTAV